MTNLLHHGAIGLYFLQVALTLFCGQLLLAKLYRSHGYLFQVGFSKRNLQNWIELTTPLASSIPWRRYRRYLAAILPQAGLSRHWDATKFIALQLVIALMVVALGYVMLCLLLGMPLLFLPGVVILCAGFPLLKIMELAKSRLHSCKRDLSYFLDYLALAISSGMEFSQALAEISQAAPESPLKDEFRQMDRELRLGKTKREALENLEGRLPAPEIRVFVQNLIQGLQMGTDMANTLTTISQSFNAKRFQRAEEEAGKISVRMMLPMLIFILPVVLLIIVGPMMLSFIAQ